MPATGKQWAKGYALQALSDLRAREALVKANAEKCHRLHFLQMAAEKACKAHLTIASGHDSVRRSHAYIARILPMIARQYYTKLNDNNEISRWEVEAIKRLAREIQVLAPACSEGDLREDNSEYPWADSKGEVCIPCEYSFPNIDDGSRLIVRLIRLIRTAAESCIQ
jgi:tRNA nucleotidyltransferase/poly(A) polymerase